MECEIICHKQKFICEKLPEIAVCISRVYITHSLSINGRFRVYSCIHRLVVSLER